MKHLITVLISVLPLATPSGVSANLKHESVAPYNKQLIIRVTEGGWGDVDVDDIQAVLYSTANELLKYFPKKRLNPIMVEYDKDGPITLYRKGPNGEYIIQLDVKGRYWAQFAYQFSHEFTHVLARYEDVRIDQNPNQWFEEALGVTASLFTLRKMAVTWRTEPPYPSWRSYAPALRRYADDRMNEKDRQLPSNMTLAKWYREIRNDLRSKDVALDESRDKQFVVASQLLPIFEQNPDFWEAISYLNLGKSDVSNSFENYLNKWYINSPEKHRRFIRKIIYMFVE
ncbi:hypothetical protein HYR99_25715 [Candidatus Poribacteria bacterium]|nr:hypothetical protein [Candidatus Poribacteria bacterium]